jgi:hypothetical protein
MRHSRPRSCAPPNDRPFDPKRRRRLLALRQRVRQCDDGCAGKPARCRCRQRPSSNGGINSILPRSAAAPATINTDGGAKLARGEGRALRPLRAARRQGVIGEGRPDRLLEDRFVACVPELVECSGSLHVCIALRVGNLRGNDEFVDLDALGGECRCGQGER